MADKLNDVYSEIVGEMNSTENPPAEAPIETPAETPAEIPPETTETAETAETPEAEQPQKPDFESLIKAGQAQAQQMATIEQQMKALSDENAKLKAAVEQSQKVVTQQSDVAKEAVLKSQPKLDFERLTYMPEEERQAEIAKAIDYFVSQKVGEIEGKVKPVLDKYAQTERENEQNRTFEAISKSNTFPGFAESKGSIDNIMANLDKLMPQLAGADIQQKYTLAYLIDQGYKNKPKSTDDIVNEALKNPDVIKKIREKSAKEQTEANKTIPTFQASGSVPASPAAKPSRLENIRDEVLASYKR